MFKLIPTDGRFTLLSFGLRKELLKAFHLCLSLLAAAAEFAYDTVSVRIWGMKSTQSPYL